MSSSASGMPMIVISSTTATNGTHTRMASPRPSDRQRPATDRGRRFAREARQQQHEQRRGHEHAEEPEERTDAVRGVVHRRLLVVEKAPRVVLVELDAAGNHRSFGYGRLRRPVVDESTADARVRTDLEVLRAHLRVALHLAVDAAPSHPRHAGHPVCCLRSAHGRR